MKRDRKTSASFNARFLAYCGRGALTPLFEMRDSPRGGGTPPTSCHARHERKRRTFVPRLRIAGNDERTRAVNGHTPRAAIKSSCLVVSRERIRPRHVARGRRELGPSRSRDREEQKPRSSGAEFR